MSNWLDVASVDEILPGECQGLVIENQRIAIVNHDGQFYAVEDNCTHAGFPLSQGCVEEDKLICPLHGAAFCVKTGKVLDGPAFEDIATYPIRVAGDKIQIDMSEI